MFAQSSISNITDACIILNNIRAKPAHPLISFDDMRDLIDILSNEKKKETVKKQ